PSDSFPGLVGQITGGNPKTTGIYYDDSWNRSLLPAGTTNCAAAAPGGEGTNFWQAGRHPTSLGAGQGRARPPHAPPGQDRRRHLAGRSCAVAGRSWNV